MKHSCARALVLLVVLGGCGATEAEPTPAPTATGTPTPASTATVGAPAPCSEVELVFARGTSEAPGLGIVGARLHAALRRELPGDRVGAHAVDYAAAVDQSSVGAGAVDMTRHLIARARRCPRTRFVLGGYSQGASVTDVVLGMPAGVGAGPRLPRFLAPRVAAVVVFGNPSRLRGRRLDRDGGRFAGRALDDCNRGDPICNAGDDFAQHLAYRTDGSAAAAARFVTRRLG